MNNKDTAERPVDPGTENAEEGRASKRDQLGGAHDPAGAVSTPSPTSSAAPTINENGTAPGPASGPPATTVPARTVPISGKGTRTSLNSTQPGLGKSGKIWPWGQLVGHTAQTGSISLAGTPIILGGVLQCQRCPGQTAMHVTVLQEGRVDHNNRHAHVNQTVKVKDGDELRIFPYTFTYKALEAGAASPQTVGSTVQPAEAHSPAGAAAPVTSSSSPPMFPSGLESLVNPSDYMQLASLHAQLDRTGQMLPGPASPSSTYSTLQSTAAQLVEAALPPVPGLDNPATLAALVPSSTAEAAGPSLRPSTSPTMPQVMGTIQALASPPAQATESPPATTPPQPLVLPTDEVTDAALLAISKIRVGGDGNLPTGIVQPGSARPRPDGPPAGGEQQDAGGRGCRRRRPRRGRAPTGGRLQLGDEIMAEAPVPEKGPTASQPDPARVAELVVTLEERLIPAAAMEHGWETLPYYIGEGTKQRLRSTAFIHLKGTRFGQLVSSLPSSSERVLLGGPTGGEIYIESVVRALAKEMGAALLLVEARDIVRMEEEQEGGEVTVAEAGTTGPTQNGGLFPPVQDDGDPDDYLGLDDEAQCLLQDDEDPCFGGCVGGSGPRGRSWNPFMTGPAPGNPARGRDGKPAAVKTVFRKGDRVKYVGGAVSKTRDAPGFFGGPGGFFGGPWGPFGGPGGFFGGPGGPFGGPGGFFGGPGGPFGGPRDYAPHMSSQAMQSGSLTPCPSINSCGEVVHVFEGRPEKVGVRFDDAIPGGIDLGGCCEAGHGAYCASAELAREQDEENPVDAELLARLQALQQVIAKAAAAGPLIVLYKGIDRLVAAESANSLTAALLQELMRASQEGLPVLHIASRPTKSSRQESPPGFLAGLVPPGAMVEYTTDAHGEAYFAQERSKGLIGRLSRLFPNRVQLRPPTAEPALAEWKRRIGIDVKTLKARANRVKLATVLDKCGLACPELDTVELREAQLTPNGAERVVGSALALQVMSEDAPVFAEGVKPILLPRYMVAGMENVMAVVAEKEAPCPAVQNIMPESEYERRLLSEVVTPTEIGVGFNDIGALDNVKRTLQEVVMLPLQRPELFVRGSLNKPTRGLLMYGPPGTGKTMLAKAVAFESGANFLNISMASLASKWFGDGEKYVKSLFTLAHKIAPCVIFVDEIDAMLGRRDKVHEHEASRKMKNEFMACWDGLRTSRTARVLVMAATNRPQDLDEAVVRRMPRRLLVDLPGKENREKILQVILRDEHLAPDFSVQAVAEMSEGYSGSDLHNLCVAAAYRPIRDFLAEEKKAAAAAAASTPALASTRDNLSKGAAASSNPGDALLAGIPVTSKWPHAGAPVSDTSVPGGVPSGGATEKIMTYMPGDAANVHASNVADPAGDEQEREKASVSRQGLEGGSLAAEDRGDARQAATNLDGVFGSKGGTLAEGEGTADDHRDGPGPGDAGVRPMKVEGKGSVAGASGRETGDGDEGSGSVQKNLTKAPPTRSLATKDDNDPLSRPPELRPLTVADFKEAMKQVGASASKEEGYGTDELKKWHETFGENGSRTKTHELTYIM